ncbi:MAG: nitroreductase family protein [Candidatus Omnitrophota bacterium]
MKQEVLKTIIEAAVRAPSLCNMQPWRFRSTSGGLEIRLQQTHPAGFFEAGYRCLDFSAGAVIENIRVAANCEGYEPLVRYLPDSEEPLWAATVTFKERVIVEHPHRPALWTRRTNRAIYRPWPPIASQTYRDIQDAIGVEDDFTLRWVKRSHSAYGPLGRMACRCAQMCFENRQIHRELAQMLGVDPASGQRQADALDHRSFGLGSLGRPAIGLAGSWQRVERLNRFGLSGLYYLYNRLRMSSSEAVGLFVAKRFERANFLYGGQLMQRLWHEITRQRLCMQPIMPLPIFMWNLELNAGGCLSSDQKRKGEDCARRLERLAVCKNGEKVMFMFRIGAAAMPKTGSARRPVDTFLEFS